MYGRGEAESFSIVTFGGKTSLAVSRPSVGYQGYVGQPWRALALRGAQSAFAVKPVEGVDAALVRSEAGFSAQLTNIEEQAGDVMGDLTLAALNGQIMVFPLVEGLGRPLPPWSVLRNPAAGAADILSGCYGLWCNPSQATFFCKRQLRMLLDFDLWAR